MPLYVPVSACTVRKDVQTKLLFFSVLFSSALILRTRTSYWPVATSSV